MQDLISVIVPVYKVEKYLKRCVDSILAQTYPCLEVVHRMDVRQSVMNMPERTGESG